MKLFDRLLEWAHMGDGEKVQLDRRLFLQGMVATSVGLVVPTAAVFDMGRRILEPEGPVEREIIGKMQIAGPTNFGVGDLIMVAGSGTENDGKYYVVSSITGSDLYLAEATQDGS